jgi:hypothetical protein
LSKNVFSSFAILVEAALRVVCPTVKISNSSSTNGETSIKSTQTYFPPKDAKI